MINEQLEADMLSHGVVITGDINGKKTVVVPLSGGKDSQSCLVLALREHPPESILCLFCDTGYEHPITYAHVEETAKRLGVDLVTLSAGTVESVCKKNKRLPGGGARHCTDALKIRPSKYFYKYFGQLNGGCEVWYGMRSDESAEREKRYRHKISGDTYKPNDVIKNYPKYLADKLNVMFRLPIIDWSTSEIFELLDGTENQLYKEGFDRVGCFPCLAGGEKWQMKAFHFDDVGRKHFAIAEDIAHSIGREVLMSKKYTGQCPGCAICSI